MGNWDALEYLKAMADELYLRSAKACCEKGGGTKRRKILFAKETVFAKKPVIDGS